MDAIDLRALRDATFCGTDTEFYATATRKHVPSERERCSPDTLVHCLRRHLTVDSPRTGPPGMVDEKRHTTTLRYIFQNRRAHHVSGRPDPLPFKDGHTAEQVFELLSLPYSYFQIANGSLTVAEAAVHLDASGLPQTLDMIVHCISKGGDWALALSHDAAAGTTSAFCSVESCLGSADLLASVEALRGLSTHPMLIPCVMFAYILRNAVARRHAIKARLRVLERDIGLLSESLLRAAHDGHQEPHTLADSAVHIARLSDNLNSCRAEQGSREGRYHFWRSYHAALQKGFEYYGQILARDSRLYESESHARLLRWANLNWAQLQSLRTRDMDHVVKVNEASDMVGVHHYVWCCSGTHASVAVPPHNTARQPRASGNSASR